ncbi:hypothetical protein PG996_007142 [Apiospora saccharicola]|uniref:Uncharacterized protein n=1 Tax=Apiospora saccharicola TaxID=335842 RepID=A0ABR1VCQ7_9PEZI
MFKAVISVFHGRVKFNTSYKEHLSPRLSRCVLVEGHPDLVNETSLPLLLRGRLLSLAGRSLAEIKEEAMEVRPRYITTGRNIVELCFHRGFYGGGAGLAVDALLLEENPRIWSVRYGEDPCARPGLGCNEGKKKKEESGGYAV